MSEEKSHEINKKLDNLTNIGNKLKDNNEEGLDDKISLNHLIEQSKKDKLKHKIKITNNIYDFLSCITTKLSLFIIIPIVLFIIYPFSYIKIPFINNSEINIFINSYFKIILESLKTFGTFIIGVIITDWASSKYKDDD